jgi:3-oxoacyl-[acyl-carrier protein] reductase
MDLQLAGKIALVAGGAGGIGKEICKVLNQEGATVAVCDFNQAALENFVEGIQPVFSTELLLVQADITKLTDVQSAVRKVMDAFGRIDILVNSVGNPPTGAFTDLRDEAWKEAFDLKFFGYVRMCREVIPHMIKNRWGRIVNLIGTSGKKAGRENYCGGSVNAALMILTANLAAEMGKWNILVNGICPGPVMTDLWDKRVKAVAAEKGISSEAYMERICAEIPLNRIAEPKDIAHLVAYLASDKAGYITGACILVDGGMSRCI